MKQWSKLRQGRLWIAIIVGVLLSQTVIRVQAEPSAILGVGPGAGCTHQSLSAALAAANDGDTIHLGVTTQNFLSYNISNKTLTIIGGFDSDCVTPNGTRTTISAQPIFGTTSSVISAVTTSTKQLFLTNLNLRNGADATHGGGLNIDGPYQVVLNNVHAFNNRAGNGGGISVRSGRLSLLNGSAVYNNNSTGVGGGIFCFNSTLQVFSSSVGLLGGNEPDSDNNNTGDSGGGMHVHNCSVQLVDATVANNTATVGAGIEAVGTTLLTLTGTNTKVISNTASLAGGGIWAYNGASVVVNSGRINHNTATNGHGGGVSLGSNSTLLVNNQSCSIFPCAQLNGNRAKSEGGAVYQSVLAASSSFYGTELRGNSADEQGSAIATFSNSTLNNAIVSDGAGLANALALGGSANVTVAFSTFAYNNPNSRKPLFDFVSGGMLSANGIVAWKNGTLAASSTVNGPFSISNSLIEDDWPAGPNLLVADPQFLVDGPDGDYHLGFGSPAIDHTQLTASSVTTDVDGEARPHGADAFFDAGADEMTRVVGLNGAPCAFASIGDAVAAAADGDTVFVSAGKYRGPIGAIGIDVTIAAAVADCSAETATPVELLKEPLNNQRFATIQAGATVTMTRIHSNGGLSSKGGHYYVNANGKLVLNHSHVGFGAAVDGAGVYVDGELTLLDAQLFSNNASGDGGAIYISDSGSVSMYGDSSIGSADGSNSASGNGGGVYIEGGTTDGGALAIFDDGKVDGNLAVSGFGGGIYVQGGASSVLLNGEGVSVAQNLAERGGGIYIEGEPPQARTGLDIKTNVTIKNGAELNSNDAAHGAALYMKNSVALTLDNAHFENNDASVGGGIYQIHQGATLDQPTISISNTTFHYNHALAGEGGAIAAFGPVSVTVAGATFSSNTAQITGGAVHLQDSTLAASTDAGDLRFEFNVSADGGGLYLNNVQGVLEGSTHPFTVVGNAGVGTAGTGGGFMMVNSDVTLVNTKVYSNVANAAGGGIYASLGSTVTVRDSAECNPLMLPANHYCSEIRDNLTLSEFGSGGGIHSEASTVHVEQTALIGNAALIGAAYYADGPSTATLRNSLVTHNTGTNAVQFDTNATIFNEIKYTTMAANNVIDSDLFLMSPSSVQRGALILWSGGVLHPLSSTAISSACSFSSNGVGGVNQDPMFITTARGDFRLAHNSPAVDMCTKYPEFDLDRQARPGPSTSGLTAGDAGAFETQSLPTTVGLAGQSAENNVKSPFNAWLLLALVTMGVFRPKIDHPIVKSIRRS